MCDSSASCLALGLLSSPRKVRSGVRTRIAVWWRCAAPAALAALRWLRCVARWVRCAALVALCGARGDYDEVGADDSTWAKADREAARRREDSSFIEGIRESGAHVVPSLVERFPSGSGEWSERDSRKAQRARRKKQLAAGGGAARGDPVGAT